MSSNPKRPNNEKTKKSDYEKKKKGKKIEKYYL